MTMQDNARQCGATAGRAAKDSGATSGATVGRASKKSRAARRSDLSREFFKTLDSLTARVGHNRGTLLHDFLEASFRSIRGQTLTGVAWRENEDAYLKIVNRYANAAARGHNDAGASVMDAFASMLGLTALALQAKPVDFLGPIYTEIASSPELGQFFTPDALCELMAHMQIGDARRLLEQADRPFLMLSEPACGCGAMILASNLVLAEQGLDLGREIHWVAVDVDFHAMAAAYVQASLTGASGTFIHGDTLRLEQWMTSFTPAAIAWPKIVQSPAKLEIEIS